MQGQPFLSPRAQAALTRVLRDGEKLDPAELLSPRELEVLKRVATGLSSKEIGTALGISPRTVETHRASLMRKLDLHSVAELTRFAMEKGLVPPPLVRAIRTLQPARNAAPARRITRNMPISPPSA
jgi:DNA-binding NarL/FixJ family response regulator